MNENTVTQELPEIRSPFRAYLYLALAGAVCFVGFCLFSPLRAWQAYLINFLFWSALSQGGLLFSMIMHLTKAKWSGPVQNISESLAAFFPVSFLLFLILFLGKSHIFPWVGQDLHGKEAWLNLSFLFTRDMAGLLVLYFLGFGYLYFAMAGKIAQLGQGDRGRLIAEKLFRFGEGNPERCNWWMTRFSVLYALSFVGVVTLISFDLAMSMDPHWISTLFGAYSFVKTFYGGLGALVLIISLIHIRMPGRHMLTYDHFHDLGKLFFGFAVVWAYFFYSQFLVIWYGNIPEETHYVLARIMLQPWRPLAIAILFLCFLIPFVVLMNEKMKRNPQVMLRVSALSLFGLFLEHLLLIGPALDHHAHDIPFGLFDLVIGAGFFGLAACCVSYFFKLFPEVILGKVKEVR